MGVNPKEIIRRLPNALKRRDEFVADRPVWSVPSVVSPPLGSSNGRLIVQREAAPPPTESMSTGLVPEEVTGTPGLEVPLDELWRRLDRNADGFWGRVPVAHEQVEC